MNYNTQNELLLNKLMLYYNNNNNLDNMLNIINGQSNISLRIVDWFVTNYAKKNFTVYNIEKNNDPPIRFKVYNDYKLKLKAYSKKRFDPFCRWERIVIPYKNNTSIQTTIGQLNFFKWAMENNVIQYIEENYKIIDNDMNSRNSINKMKNVSISSTDSNSSTTSSISSNNSNGSTNSSNKTRKKREELSINASRSIKKESLEVLVTLN
tara:strand:- start:8 stop:634 length:627 start_codon:yes stop_codon:yes gene_type:complete